MLDPETLSPAKSLSSYLETFSLFPAHALSTKAAMAQVSLSRSAMLTRPASRTVRIGSARRGQRARRAGEGTDGSRSSFFFGLGSETETLARSSALVKAPFRESLRIFVTVLARRSSVKMKERKRRQKRLSFADKGRKTSPPLAHGRRCEKALSLSLSRPRRDFFLTLSSKKNTPPPFPPSTTPPRPAPPAPPP